jgi:hypothetical protein
LNISMLSREEEEQEEGTPANRNHRKITAELI